MLKAHAQLVRVSDLPDVWLAYVIGILLLNRNATLTLPILFGGIALMCALFFANVTNDIADIEIDRINRQNRVLPSGVVSVSGARGLAYLYLIASLIFAVLGGVYTFVIIATLLILGYNYSYGLKLQKKHFLGSVLLVISFIIAPFFLGNLESGGGPILRPAFFNLLSGLGLFSFVKVWLKDFQDSEGDLYFKKITPLIRVGKRFLFILACSFACLGFFTITLFLNETFSGKEQIILQLLLVAFTISLLTAYVYNNKVIINLAYLLKRLWFVCLLFFLLPL